MRSLLLLLLLGSVNVALVTLAPSVDDPADDAEDALPLFDAFDGLVRFRFFNVPLAIL